MCINNRQLHSERQAVSDVPAVYFVEPSAENIGRICKDLAAGLYESFYLNFTSLVPRVLLEDLAYNAVQCGSSALIAKVRRLVERPKNMTDCKQQT